MEDRRSLKSACHDDGSETDLLDEPAAGLNPSERAELVKVITRSYDEGYSFFLIEHNMDVVMKISDYITVLSFGKMRLQKVNQKRSRRIRRLSVHIWEVHT